MKDEMGVVGKSNCNAVCVPCGAHFGNFHRLRDAFEALYDAQRGPLPLPGHSE